MMTNHGQNQRVFISYAREDTEAANRLYNNLKRSGLDPWLDTQSILGGQNWRIVIRQAIRNSEYFIPLLSPNSIEKRGYVQKELREALEVLDELPKSKIFVIPVRIDDCKITDKRLRQLNIINLFPDWKQGIQRVLKSLGIKYKKLKKISYHESLAYRYDRWDELLRTIHQQKCCPIIGPDANLRWIPPSHYIAIKWTDEHKYPFENSNQLPQVAQYLAIKENNEMYPKKYLANLLKSIQAPNFSLSEYENTVYRVLADLNLPIYITTNYDHLMEKALESRGKDPKPEFCRWKPAITEYAKNAQISFVSDDRKYIPRPANPLVFHLYGDMEHPISMVLTEQDYIDFLLNISSLDRNPVMMPGIIRKSFASSSLLFVGYMLNGMNSRITFRSIANSLGLGEPPLSIAIMPTPASTLTTGRNPNQILNYLESYAKSIFKFNIYWSDLFLFLDELRNSFDAYKKKMNILHNN